MSAFIALAFILIVLFWIISKYTRPYNSVERNKIVFNSSFENVQDSIIQMMTLLDKLPTYKDDWVNYSISDSDILSINFGKVGNITNLNTNDSFLKTYTFKDFAQSDLTKFVRIAVFLKNNYLTECDFFKSSKSSNFIYRLYNEDAGDYQDDLLRIIFYSPYSNYDNNAFKEIDKNENLILLSNKEAEIWVREK